MQTKLWNRNFTLLIAATGLGAIGGIAGGFAMSFLVFDETGSTGYRVEATAYPFCWVPSGSSMGKMLL